MYFVVTFKQGEAMKSIIAVLLLMTSLSTVASTPSPNDVCKQMEKTEELVVLREGSVLTKENWNKIDVIFNFDYESCHDAFLQELILFNGRFYWKMGSMEDRCDGGNTYGAIYNYRLTTPIAHVYDGDIYCEEDWIAEEISQ